EFELLVELAREPARPPLPRPAQLHRFTPQLDRLSLRVVGQSPVGQTQCSLPGAPAVLVEGLDLSTPGGMLAVVDLAEIQNRLLHHPAAGTASALDKAPVAVLLAILDSPCGAQVHADGFYANPHP